MSFRTGTVALLLLNLSTGIILRAQNYLGLEMTNPSAADLYHGSCEARVGEGGGPSSGNDIDLDFLVVNMGVADSIFDKWGTGLRWLSDPDGCICVCREPLK